MEGGIQSLMQKEAGKTEGFSRPIEPKSNKL